MAPDEWYMFCLCLEKRNMPKKKKNTSTSSPIPANVSSDDVQDVDESESKEEIVEEDQPKKESKSAMTKRHQKELKDLKKETDKLQHSVSKNDKQGKKDLAEKTKKMEEDLLAKHAQELKSLSQESEAPEIPQSAHESSTGPTRQQLRREKAAAKEADREREIFEAKLNTVNKGAVETDQIKKILQPQGLTIFDIKPDGDCLYNAIKDQQTRQGVTLPTDYHMQLRRQIADHMLAHQDDFMPFVDSEDGDLVSEDQFRAFCEKTATTHMWGGQLEMKAMSRILQKPIQVYGVDTALTMGEEYSGEPLRLSFHRHMYSLGAHYNSVILGTNDDDQE
eukprot:TRINITY_DN20031_c0_g1_i1.p1 TRINITY_DN20031_c0_g1~~TRINITY_DN20031_c0_g1_i1.p1  ORF type:complete len:335 (+),score=73.41 TRINITY_DN20031_c0_g1_i1:69-1073(+)